MGKRGRELTEADLLRAPLRDYMSAEQLEYFRRRLLDLRHQLWRNVDETGENLRSTTVVAPDPFDRATQEEEQAIELRVRDRERKLLKKIDQALRRIEDGSYGFCEETGEPIGIGRLLARPTATLSLEAQERREKMERVYGG
ncbi:MAG TPA: RNA polymerase-binding protein DksA [Burkholderiales bacterium]|nr:RNA polymerase-binding protein DksA [Burkholderiales bacterium]